MWFVVKSLEFQPHFSDIFISAENVSTKVKLVLNNLKMLFEVCGVLEIVMASNGIQGHEGHALSITNSVV